jgi:hypothetical protein
MTRVLVLVCVAAVALALLAPAASAAPVPVSVTADRTIVSTEIGRDFALHTKIVNRGSLSTPPLVAHLNVLSLQPEVYLDPEDWSSHRTRFLGPVPAGSSRAITWKVKAVTSGEAAIFVAVLPQQGGAQPPANSPTVHVSISKRTTLNSGSILPLAAGMPAALRSWRSASASGGDAGNTA